ncbi:MAG TPA: hypothetical protein GXZ35_04575 [Acholeplasmataceae bacterium]|nr:hypothetical protein [Acholeplasmataceae bacterium]
MGRLKITQEDDSVRKVAYLDEVQDVADDVDDLLEDVDELQGDLETVKTDYLAQMDTKANIDGYYEPLSVGTADNLAGKGDGVGATFIHRTTGGDADVADGTATIKSIKGNTIVWNQLVDDDTESVTLISDNKYITIIDNISALVVGGNSAIDVTGGTDMVFNVTLMFGTGNEPTTAAEFEAIFPDSYYPYDTGSLLNFNATGIKTVGFNQFDLSKGYAKVLAGNKYVIGGALTKLEFAKTLTDSKVEIITITEDGMEVYTPERNGYIFVTNADETTIIHLKWSGIRDGEFEEYWESERELPIVTYFPDGMHSLPSGVCDEFYNTKTIKHIKMVDMGSLSWSFSASSNYFYCQCQDRKISTFNAIRSSKYLVGSRVSTNNLNDKEIIVSVASNRIFVRDDDFTDANSFKAGVAGAMLIYELDIPIETYVDEPLNLSYKVSDFGTEEIISDNEDIPQTSPFVGNIVYGINAVDTLRRLPTEYISKNSMINFISGLESAIKHNIVMTWDETTQKYKFVFIEKENGGDEE